MEKSIIIDKLIKNGVISYNNGCYEVNNNLDNSIIVDKNDDEYIFHRTDFFPKNGIILCNYDGNKTYPQVKVHFNGIEKNCNSISHRHTVHFTVNHVVQDTSLGEGVWSKKKYTIIEPKKEHDNQYIIPSFSDLFTLKASNSFAKAFAAARCNSGITVVLIYKPWLYKVSRPIFSNNLRRTSSAKY